MLSFLNDRDETEGGKKGGTTGIGKIGRHWIRCKGEHGSLQDILWVSEKLLCVSRTRLLVGTEAMWTWSPIQPPL